MDKKEFLRKLNKGLSCQPKNEREERVNFYAEMIEDYIEEGLTEEQAINKIGDVNDVITQIKGEQKAKSRRNKSGRNGVKIALITIGAPVWCTILALVIVVIFSLYLLLWACVVSFWAGFASLLVCGVSSVFVFVLELQSTIVYVAIIGAGIFSLGLAVLAFYLCKYITIRTIDLGKRTIVFTLNQFGKRRG